MILAVAPLATATPRDLPRWLWLYFPFALLALHFALRAGASDAAYLAWMDGEYGAPEIGTVLFLLIAAAIGASIVARRGELCDHRLIAWIVVIAAGAFYWAGEEASWGQHYFRWSTPEVLEAVNRKRETNLHNIGRFWGELLLDYAPRMVLMAAVLGAGVIAPIALRAKPALLAASSRLRLFLPTSVVVPTALIALSVGEIERASELAGVATPHLLRLHDGEVREYYLALFVMLYLASLRARLAPVASVRAEPAVSPPPRALAPPSVRSPAP
jgi:hypothetical protein